MKVVKTESSNKAESIGFDGQVVHHRSEDGRGAEKQNNLEATIAEDASFDDEYGSDKSRSSKGGFIDFSNDEDGTGTLEAEWDPSLPQPSSIHLTNTNNTNANKNDDDGPPLVAILAVFCFGMIVTPSLSSQLFYKNLHVNMAFTYAYAIIPFVLALVYLLVRWCYSRYGPLPLVAILSEACLGIIFIAEYAWISPLPEVTITFGVILFLLIMWLLWKAHGVNQGNGSSRNVHLALVAILGVICLGGIFTGSLLWYEWGVDDDLASFEIAFFIATVFGVILLSLSMGLFCYYKARRANQGSGSCSNGLSALLVPILAVVCLGGIPTANWVWCRYLPGEAFVIAIAFGVTLFLLIVWLFWKAHRANQGSGRSSNSPVISSNHGLNTGTIQEKYPSNSYSFLAVYDPIRDTKLFCFGLFISLFQFALLFLMAANVIVPRFRTAGEVDNPGVWSGKWFGSGIFPSNCSAIVRATQILSLMAYVIFPSAILNDTTESVQLFPGFKQHDADGRLKRLRFACSLRFLQGFMSTLSVFVLVMTSTDVIEILLNFTATNFISELDDIAFEQAENGKYGPIIEDAVHNIKGENLPNPLSKNAKHKRYKYGIAFISIVLYIATVGVMVAQDNIKVWVTPTVRVQFNDERSAYSGCYHMDKYRWDSTTNRYEYTGDGNNARVARMGYCLDERRWLIYEGGDVPCAAFGEEGFEIAHSSKTDFYDIQSSIAEDWFTPFNTPIDDMYFIQADNIKESCEAFAGNSDCEEFLNNFDYQYDGGDCCAATCVGDRCGFIDDRGKRYPNCKDPSMTPFTIRIDNNDKITILEESVLKLDCISDEEEYEVFAIDASKVWTSIKIDANPVSYTLTAGWTESAMIGKGSNCKLYLSDDEETIIPLNYSVYHGFDNFEGVTGNEVFSIFSTTEDQPMNETIASFEVPRKLKSTLDK